MKTEIIKYYDALADTYDIDRFSNSYGDYIHQQELRVLHKYLSKDSISMKTLMLPVVLVVFLISRIMEWILAQKWYEFLRKKVSR